MALVLVIDDNDGLRSMVRRALESAGHQVVEASDGRQGLMLARERRPDAMITDILMPTKEGLETIREARASWPRLAIIAMSGGGNMRTLDLLGVALQFGANKVLEKPFRPAALRAALDEVLQARPDG